MYVCVCVLADEIIKKIGIYLFGVCRWGATIVWEVSGWAVFSMFFLVCWQGGIGITMPHPKALCKRIFSSRHFISSALFYLDLVLPFYHPDSLINGL